jgi:hypothetical protein
MKICVSLQIIVLPIIPFHFVVFVEKVAENNRFVYEQNGELPWGNRSDRAQFLAIWDKAVIWTLHVFQIGLL